MSKERLHHFTRRNMELGATFDVPNDPVDKISDADQTDNHYSRIRKHRHPHGPSAEARTAKLAYQEDEKETHRQKTQFENVLIDEVTKSYMQHPKKQDRLRRKDGLDKKAYQTLSSLSRDAERTQESHLIGRSLEASGSPADGPAQEQFNYKPGAVRDRNLRKAINQNAVLNKLENRTAGLQRYGEYAEPAGSSSWFVG